MRTPYVPSPMLIEYLAERTVTHAQIGERFTSRDDIVLDAAQKAALAELRAGAGSLTIVEGAQGSGRATAIAAETPGLVRIVDLWGKNGEMIESLLLDLRTLIALDGGAVLLRNLDWLWGREESGRSLAAIAAFVDSSNEPVYATVRAATGDVPTRYAPRRVRWPSPGVEARGKLWRALLDARRASAADDVIQRLARRYPLGPSAIGPAIMSARTATVDAIAESDGAEVPEKVELTEERLVAAMRRGAHHSIADLARVVSVPHTWDDLILPAATREQVDLVVSRVRNAERVLGEWGFGEKLGSSTGTVVLLSGPSGTGKTMVAGLIAKALDRELVAVDLSRILSKWIGETEQRLARVFEAGEAGGHIAILIDEADALFGQRTRHVETSNDRFSNMEIDFLLERLDRFSGLAFLTSNLDGTIDTAMRRRLAAHISMPRPGERERALLWRRHLDSGRAPVDAGVDVDDLARRFPEMTGGNIRNAVLAGAYLAAEDPAGVIGHAHLMRAARIEYQSMGVSAPRSLRTIPPERP
jgi:AAA+ superfamily predicted ATPase